MSLLGRMFLKREPDVRVVSKVVCPLCDEALEALEWARKRVPCTLRVEKIDDDPELYEAYKYEVPVVFIDGVKRFYGRIERVRLERALRIAAKKTAPEADLSDS